MDRRLPFLDLASPTFSTRSQEVHTARQTAWCARTPFGYAVLRHRQGGMILRDRRFRQGSHSWPNMVGLKGSFAEFWKRSVISLEGEEHSALRKIAQNALAQEHIVALEPDFVEIAETLCDNLLSHEPFDIIDGFTEPFAGQAITTLLGLPLHISERLAADATCLGLAMGPEAINYQAEVNASVDRLTKMANRLLDAPPSGSFVARLISEDYEDRQALIDLTVISIFGGVDTTRAQLAFAAHLFSQHPEQWTWLRNNPQAVSNAIDEVIRMRPTTTWATREALEDVTIGDVIIRAGETVHILVHASATDPETGHDGNFDIRVRRKPHFGFGGGAHHCLGHLVARTDMTAALNVWLRRWEAIELAEEPVFLPDSGNTSPLTMSVMPVWAN
ncbi:cytochrome P450 [Ruegeria arenilitoris]|uniref:cytochrome P450 n=1 Tax=Ruegeria arenilitoris TaxID=1173585 RepID=UPI00147DB5E2|nr:cytochrome P450 [Ruegeria arenilitoris]